MTHGDDDNSMTGSSEHAIPRWVKVSAVAIAILALALVVHVFLFAGHEGMLPNHAHRNG